MAMSLPGCLVLLAGLALQSAGLSAPRPASHPNTIPGQAGPPQFLLHPASSFATRSRPATLNCTVADSDKATFTCNGENVAGEERAAVARSGRVVRQLTVTISRAMVEQIFAEFECECEAWSSLGHSSSRPASVTVACEFHSKYRLRVAILAV